MTKRQKEKLERLRLIDFLTMSDKEFKEYRYLDRKQRDNYLNAAKRALKRSDTNMGLKGLRIFWINYKG